MEEELTKGKECIGCIKMFENCKGHKVGAECINYTEKDGKNKWQREECSQTK